jgi:hypothetical protein
VKVTAIPFNAFLEMEESADSSRLLELSDSPHYLNHVGTVHASAQLALAEASTGQMLMQALPELADKVVAVVRRVEAKFKKPMQGVIASRPVTTSDEIRQAAAPLASRGRAVIPVTVEILDAAANVGLAATFEWFAANRETDRQLR